MTDNVIDNTRAHINNLQQPTNQTTARTPERAADQPHLDETDGGHYSRNANQLDNSRSNAPTNALPLL
eukprot:8144416-Lingulodinium_polyedra.AAC.1